MKVGSLKTIDLAATFRSQTERVSSELDRFACGSPNSPQADSMWAFFLPIVAADANSIPFTQVQLDRSNLSVSSSFSPS